MSPRHRALLLSACLIGCGRDQLDLGEPRFFSELTLLTLELPRATRGEMYTAVLLADGPDLDAIRWRIRSSEAPELELRLATGASALLAGIPQEAGEYVVEIEVADDFSTVRRSYVLQVIGGAKPLEILEGMVPTGRVGERYFASFAASGGTGSGYRWRISGLELPPGLALEPNGTPVTQISGTPTAPGTWSFRIEVRDDGGNIDRATFQISIEDALRIITASLAPASTGTFYATLIESTGGRGIHVWDAFGLPPGLAIDGSSDPFTFITGTPILSGTFEVVVRVSDDVTSAERTFELTVTAGTELEITTPSLPAGEVGIPYEAIVETTGGTLPLSWFIGGAPADLVGDAAMEHVRLHGVPLTAGSFRVGFEVTDQIGQFDTRTYTLVIHESGLQIVTQTLPPAIVGQPYAAAIEASSGMDPYSWAVIAGALPDGLALAPSGTPATQLAGTPTLAGDFTFTVEVTDSNNRTATRVYTLSVMPPPTPLRIVTTSIGDGARCSGYNQEIRATGGVGPYTWAVRTPPPLPDGLQLLPAGTPTTRLLGAPRVAGTFTATVTVTDSRGDMDAAAFVFTIAATGGAAWAVFSGDIVFNGARELYAIDLCDGAPGPTFTISALSGRSGGVSLFSADTVFSPDRRHVAFLGDYTTAGVTELYTVDLSGPMPGPRIAMSGNVPSSADVIDFAWSPDGSRLVFRAELDTPGMIELYLVDLANPQPIKVNGALQPAGDVHEWRWSPDGNRVAYRADQIADALFELFVVDLSGATPGAPLRANTDLTPGGQVDELFLFSPDGSQLLFLAPLDSLGVAELYLTNVFAPAPVKVNGPLVPNADVRAGRFAFAPDGSALFYIADAFFNELYELFLVELIGGIPSSPVRLTPANPPAFDVMRAAWSPDSTRILYVADPTDFSIDELFLIELGAVPGAPARITPPYTPAFGTSGFIESRSLDEAWSPDGRWIVFRDRVETAVRALLVDAGGAPGAPIRIDGSPLVSSLNVSSFDFSWDGTSLVMRGDLDTEGVDELYRISLIPFSPAPIKMNPPLVAGGEVSLSTGDVAFTDEGAILYRADQDTDGVFEIYRIETPGNPQRIHAALTTLSDTFFFRVR